MSLDAEKDLVGEISLHAENVKDVLSSSRSTGSSDADQSEFEHSWGPEAFLEANGLDNLEAAHTIRHVAPGYDVVSVLEELIEGDEDKDALFVVDLSTVMRKISDWKKLMPRIHPFYAVKCNDDVAVCRMLADSGCGFDCASKAEIQAALSYGISPDLIIYANPCKQASMLRYARSVGVTKMTADNVEELHKIKQVHPTAQVVLRIAVDDSKSVCRFNSKFGAQPAEWDELLRTSRALDLNVLGFSFHVGSGCGDLKPFADAVSSARDAFDLAATYGYTCTLLDCGGGYPGDERTLSFARVAAVLSEAVDHYFPAGCGVTVIAEPGRYVVTASHTYATAVIAKRHLTSADHAAAVGVEVGVDAPQKEEADVALYINDGVYGCFNCVVFDHAVVTPRPFPSAACGLVGTKLFGPTCDSIDVVMSCALLPPLNVGEWLWFDNMGAYTRCAASNFNGQGKYAIHYVWSGMP
ncbi:pyridoxal-dependent decarboxylase [Baffinella frigidus]|nr:pyridoxal-dependent decarboxylase [Cryptophyta sp. CCMP2293]